MFIRRKNYNQIIKRLDHLERQTKTHGEFLHRDYSKLRSDNDRLKALEDTIGQDAPSVMDSMLAHYFAGFAGRVSAKGNLKRLTLIEKVEQIMDHLDLVERHTQASVKLAKKPEPAKRKAVKKGGKK
ncbi:MAG TPA: hypothetical protein VD907_07065 [Verrucomicrobiae bacterium]|nr:hypothetical protein [Verrucomicrobiae bacterium]